MLILQVHRGGWTQYQRYGNLLLLIAYFQYQDENKMFKAV